MSRRALHIAWLGARPHAKETGGAAGVADDLLYGLAAMGHRIDCMFAGQPGDLPERLREQENLSFTWSRTGWRWGSWYNRTKLSTFVAGLAARAIASRRLRREVARRHREDPFDVVFQFCHIETLSLPASVRRAVPLLIHPATYMRGELRFLIAERKLALRSQPAYVWGVAVLVTWLRSLVQRCSIRRASLVVCISAIFRDNLVRDLRVPRERTVVVPNPLRLARFDGADLTRGLGDPPAVVVLSRIAARKGIDDVVAVARILYERGSDARIRVIGPASLSSNYTALLEDLPPSAKFLGRIRPSEVAGELARSDVLLQPSRYEPFGLTVAEALASGVPVVASNAVGAVEEVDRSVAAVREPGDAAGMADAIEALLARLASEPAQLRRRARAEAERLWAPELVCEQLDAALQQLSAGSAAAARGTPARESPRPLRG